MATAKKVDPKDLFINPKNHVRDRIVIHDNPQIPKEGQFLALNGYAFLVKPGQEVDIPRPVRLMLDTRIQTETQQDQNGDTHTREIPRITYTLIKEDVGEPNNPPEMEKIG